MVSDRACAQVHPQVSKHIHKQARHSALSDRRDELARTSAKHCKAVQVLVLLMNRAYRQGGWRGSHLLMVSHVLIVLLAVSPLYCAPAGAGKWKCQHGSIAVVFEWLKHVSGMLPFWDSVKNRAYHWCCMSE